MISVYIFLKTDGGSIRVACIVTNGVQVAVYGDRGRKFYPRLSAAIGAVESRGYSIDASATEFYD